MGILRPLLLFQVIAETLFGCTCYHVRARLLIVFQILLNMVNLY